MNSNYLAARTITFVLVMLVALQTKAQLVINEISQGGQNPSIEYVELLVVGTNSCTSSTVDLRSWVIDDNNGTFLLAKFH